MVTRPKIFVVGVLWIGAVFGSANAVAGRADGWSGSRVYVLGDYVLDLNRMEERWIAGRSSELRDCSTTRYFCLRSADPSLGIANFIVPKNCSEVAQGRLFRVGPHTTRVVAVAQNQSKLPPLHGDGSAPELYDLIDDANPNVIFKYVKAQGIIEILRQTSEAKITFKPPVTFDALAPCK